MYVYKASDFFLLLTPLMLMVGSLFAVELPMPRLSAVPFTQVTIRDKFWLPRQDINRSASIPTNFAMLDKSGNLHNFDLAAAGKTEGYQGPVFMDSDLYKALEAAAYSLATHPDPVLQKKIDAIISRIAAAQQKDGYLNTWYTVKEPGQRWTNLRDNHELYCAGHLIEAAVAHFQATGKRNLLNVAVKFADHIGAVFGGGLTKRMGYPGHPEIELALIKLWRVTGRQRYFDLARFFVENRGNHFFAREHQTPESEYDGTYWQDDIPICDHRNIKGHAVRACYLLSGATDVAAETQNAEMLKMIRRVWRNTIERNQYVTGGIGPSAHNEGFTEDYDLPNLSAYQETCATIALAQWNHRLALLYGDSRFSDVVERCLYNGVLSGVSQDGKRFFYVNRLESTGKHHRSEWFGCACCPPNVARTLSSLGGYAYAVDDHSLWVNLFIQGQVNCLINKTKVEWQVTTDYPWDGKVVLKPLLTEVRSFALRLRYPGWCERADLRVNGQPVKEPVVERGYFVVERTWQTGDVIELNMDMPVRRVLTHPNVKANAGQVALQRGPMVYCLEACDQSAPLSSIYLPATASLTSEWQAGLLGGVMVIKADAFQSEILDWKQKLYQTAGKSKPVTVQAIPYYAWDNRQAGAMKVWLPEAATAPPVGGLETGAQVSASFSGSGSTPASVHDALAPKNSADRATPYLHFWPHKGQDEWLQYTWPQPVRLNGSSVYWFDDTGSGECRIPAGWKLEYFVEEQWKPVEIKGIYPVAVDQWCTVLFPPLTTTKLRMTISMQPEWSAGVYEWKVEEAVEE